MATVDQHILDLADAVDLVKTVLANYNSTYSGILTSQWGAPDADDEGNLQFLGTNVTAGTRRHFAALLRNIREGAEVVIRDLAITLDRSDIPSNDTITRILGLGLRDHMLDNAKVLESRGVTHTTPSSFTGTGTGELILFTDDDQSTPDDLEAVTDGTIRFECVADQGTGRDLGAELFAVRDEAPARDIIELGGAITTGLSVQAISAAQVAAIGNAGFESALGATASATDKIPSWTATSPTNIVADTATIFRGKQSLKFSGNSKIVQVYSGLPNNAPVMLSVMFNRQVGSGLATLRIRLGSLTKTVVLSAQTGFNNRLFITDWPTNYAGSGYDVEIEIESYTSGDIYIDEVILKEFTRIGGRWFLIPAGETDFQIDDFATQDTAIAATGLIKDWLHRWFGLGFELPHAGTASVGWEDPT